MIGRRPAPVAVLILALCAIFPAAACAEAAAAYPAKPIRLIVPFPPGGGNDVIARVVGKQLSERWNQQIVIDNRGGANGMLGLSLLAQAAPDGYTLAVGAAGPLAVNPSLYSKMPYDSLKSFAPVTNMVNFPLLLVTHPSLPAKSVKELIALAKAQPGRLNFASPGSGNSGHLAGELFNSMAGVKIVHVPYKGAGPAIADLLGGQVQMMYSSIPSVLPHVQAGRLNALAIGSAKRLSTLPNIPTIAESGVPKYEAYSWVGMVAPAGTPGEIVAKLNREIIDILKVKQVADNLNQQGAVPDYQSPEAFRAYIKAEIAKWGAVVRAANIRAD
ncbi:MAG TPA: tripartite tricarboxylate transporter substrate binding protein [Burkholderiales bacterium]|nr:tripartite tricarboxylate transporter substrate binding protein [Burkholderiales bacterium]